MNDIVIVVTGAVAFDPAVVASLPNPHIVIAADGALDHALAAGLIPAALVGDLDSISADGLAWAEEHANVQRFSTDKNQTDTELALSVAADLDPARLILVGGGDRLDHTLGAIGALGHQSLTSIPSIEGWWGRERFHVIHGPGQASIATTPGATFSVLAMHGPCTGVTVAGAEWPLMSADLGPLVGHGISNVASSDQVTVSVSTGNLTIFLPQLTETPS